MITHLKLDNFKAFCRLQDIPLKPITLIYGPNSGGKSSIIQSLLLLKQSFSMSAKRSSKLIPRGEIVDLGTFKSILFGHNVRRKLQIGVSISRSSDPARRYPFAPPAAATRAVMMQFQSAKEVGSRRLTSSELCALSYSLGETAGLAGFRVDLVRVTDPEFGPERRLISPDAAFFKFADDSSAVSLGRFLIDSTKRRAARNPNLAASRANLPNIDDPEHEAEFGRFLRDSVFSGPEFLPSYIMTQEGEGIRFSPYGRMMGTSLHLLDGFTAEFMQQISSISYLGPLRSPPARHYLRFGGQVETVGTKGENTPQVIVSKGAEIRKRIDRWFADFGIPYQITPRHFGNETAGEIISINLTDKRTKVEVAPSDVGFGIGQLLPIIVEGLVAANKTICVEQPEIHLHPKLQAHLADLFIATSQRGTDADGRGNQWIIETHSESLMLRLQRRIREKAIAPSHVSVLYVEPGANGEGSRVIPLRLDEDGDFVDEWPEGFFEDRFDELFKRI
jgi:predicted ATPase